MKKRQTVRTVDRLVAVLDCFSHEKPTWSLAELCQKIGVPKSSLHRFLVSLESHGILRRDRSDKRWRLGYHLLAWGSLAAENTQLIQLARPYLEDLTKSTEETALLTVYEDGKIVCVEKVESSHPVRLTMDVGTRRLPHAGASSKILMAYLPEDEIKEIIRVKGLPKLCVNTITDPEELAIELSRIRARGYAVSCEETDQGAWGVATPIRNRTGLVLAGIGVAGPLTRYSKARIKQHIEQCRNISLQIGALLS